MRGHLLTPQRPSWPYLRERSGRKIPDADRWPVRLHDLRHFTATQLFAAGMNPKTVADRLGHADASVTLRVYIANTSGQEQAAANSLEAGLGSLAEVGSG